MAHEQIIRFPVHNASQLCTLHASIAHFRYVLCTPTEGPQVDMPSVDDLLSWQTLGPFLDTLTVGTVDLPRGHGITIAHALRTLYQAAPLTATGRTARELSTRLDVALWRPTAVTQAQPPA